MTKCWLVSEPKAGMEVQCRALGQALGVAALRKTVMCRGPWKYLPTSLWLFPFGALGSGSDPLAPPWPDLLISCGRYAVGLALAIKRASGAASFLVHIQNPRVPLEAFDAVVVPRHDHCEGENVITTLGSLHALTPALLAAEAQRFAPQLAHLPRPLLTVLIGGTNRHYRFTAQEARTLATLLIRAATDHGAGVALTASRRTSGEVLEVLRRRLRDVPCVIGVGEGENPYLGYLGLADYIVVTCDSVNMTTEACATGKPVHVVQLPGGSGRFREFHTRLEAAGMTRKFAGHLDTWRYTPLLETPAVARAIRQRMQQLNSPVGRSFAP